MTSHNTLLFIDYNVVAVIYFAALDPLTRSFSSYRSHRPTLNIKGDVRVAVNLKTARNMHILFDVCRTAVSGR
jgi:hypothetical protein